MKRKKSGTSGGKEKKSARQPAGGSRNRQSRQRPFYGIGEVCELLDLKPHVLRYWETQFDELSPSKNRAGNRVYRPADIELIGLIRRLVHEEKYTIDGARQRLADMSDHAETASSGTGSLLDEAFLDGLDRELERLIALLESAPR